MNSTPALPDGFREIFRINLQKDKKTAVFVNVFSGLLAAAMILIGNCFVSIFTLFEAADGLKDYILRLMLLLIGMLVYLILHELVHGICMKAFGAKKIRYGFTGMYAYAGYDGYFGRRAYIIIALAPIVVWGIVLLVLSFLVSRPFFWVVFFVQSINISGAAGDLYVTYKIMKLPKDILIRDTGMEMTVYAHMPEN